MKKDPMLIEKTSKTWKGVQAISYSILFTAFLFLFFSPGFSLFLFFFGAPLFLFGLLGAWWHHG